MVVVIGTGAGGSTIAKELAKNNIDVTIIEKGELIESKDAGKHYIANENDFDLLRTSCVGGSTIVSGANAIRILEKELKEFGIDLSEEFEELEKELNIHTLDDNHVGEGTKKIIKACESLKIPIELMPKFIDESKCKPCGSCFFGCPRNAKWSGKEYTEEAIKHGAKLIANTELINLVIKDNKIKGIKIKDLKTNEIKIIQDDLVILSAGAIDSAKLLKKAGIKAGENFFMDTFVTVGGVLKDINFKNEVQMNALVRSEHFILSPHYSTILYDNLKDEDIDKKDIIGIMVKIPDENTGFLKNDKIIKTNTERDVQYLVEGSMCASAILIECGVDVKTLVSTNPRGAHPAGTAAIGKVVDKNLKTEIEGLFLADASVLPVATGKPPILTIMALSKRLSKYIKKEYF